MQHIIDGLRDSNGAPATNLAFVFADVGCGVSPDHITQLKALTRDRRLLDKDIPDEKLSRRAAPWLQVQRVFGWVMNSENLTRCFWRPYQEAEFWRRGGFPCEVAPKLSRKAVNPTVQELTLRFHS